MCIHCDQYASLIAELQDQVWSLQQTLDRFRKPKISDDDKNSQEKQDKEPEDLGSVSLNHYAYYNEEDTAESK